MSLQIVLALLLALSILMQQRSAGLGSLAGGAGDTVEFERRGPEKTIYNATKVLGLLFAVNAFLIGFIV